MILLLFLFAKAADPLRIFHRIAQPIMSFEDEAKFLLISNRFRKFSKRILVNDDITIFKFEDELKFPNKIVLFPKVQQFLEEKISQNSDRLENVEFAYDEHHNEWGSRSIVAMLDRQTNKLSGRDSSGETFVISEIFQIFPLSDDIFIFPQRYYHLIASDNIFLMLIKHNFPLGMFSAAAVLDTDTLVVWAFEESLHKTSLYLAQNMAQLPNEMRNNLMHVKDLSPLFYRLISAIKEFHESNYLLSRRFLNVFRRILNGLAKIADVQDVFLPDDRRLTYLSRYFPETLAILIKRGLDVIKTENSFHIAAEYGHIDLMETFLTHGVQVDARDEDYFTALMRAARNMNVTSLKLLLAYGAKGRGRALDVMESAHSRNYQYACHENFDQCRRLLSYPRTLVQILVQKSITDKFNVLRDSFVSFCHNIIEV